MKRRPHSELRIDTREVDGEPVYNLWFAVELRDGWRAWYRLVPRDGRPVVAELRVLPQDNTPGLRPAEWSVELEGVKAEVPGDGITARLVRDEVVVGRHIYELLPDAVRRAKWKEWPELEGGGGHQVGGDPEAFLLQLLLHATGVDPEKPPRKSRRGPEGRPDAYYARLASDYVAACGTDSRHPVVDVAKKHDMKPATLRAALNRARKRGLLTRQTAGRAGGKLTPRAKSLLRKKRRKSR